MAASCCLKECSIRICCDETTIGPVGIVPPRADTFVFAGDFNGATFFLNGCFVRPRTIALSFAL